MKTKKILATVLSAVLMASLLTGCGSKPAKDSGETKKSETKVEEKKSEAKVEEKTETPATDEHMHIDVIAKGFQHQFWKAVELGTKKAAEEFGVEVTFQGPEGEGAIAQQVEYLNAAIAKNPKAICLAALDTEASLDSIKTAQDAGIPIIGFDSGVPNAPEGAIKGNASTDNYAAGALAADEMFKIIKDKVAAGNVRIGVVSQEANSQSIVQRTQGFLDKMAELIGADKVSIEGHDKFAKKMDGASVVLEVGIPAEIKDVDGAAVASALLEKADLIAIYGSNEFGANCIITANETLDKIGEGKIVAVGFDAGTKQKEAVRNKLFAGSITQDPVSIGYQAVKLAVAAAKGEAVADVDTGAKWYTAENMDAEDIAPLLYD